MLCICVARAGDKAGSHDLSYVSHWVTRMQAGQAPTKVRVTSLIPHTSRPARLSFVRRLPPKVVATTESTVEGLL